MLRFLVCLSIFAIVPRVGVLTGIAPEQNLQRALQRMEFVFLHSICLATHQYVSIRPWIGFVYNIFVANISLSQIAVADLKGHNETVLAVRWDPSNPERLASVGGDKSCKIWDTKGKEPLLFIYVKL